MSLPPGKARLRPRLLASTHPEISQLPPFAGMTRIRFNGCDLSRAARDTPVETDASVGEVSDVVDRFLDAVAATDFDAIAGCFADDARMRALVPSRLRDESGPDAIAERYRFWLGGADTVELVDREHDDILGSERLRYRLRIVHPKNGEQVMEQEGYATVNGDRITALNLVCSGFLPL